MDIVHTRLDYVLLPTEVKDALSRLRHAMEAKMPNVVGFQVTFENGVTTVDARVETD